MSDFWFNSGRFPKKTHNKSLNTYFGNRSKLDCDDGFASFNSKSEPVCNCNSPIGGFQYCGADPCHGSCIGECSKWKSGVECDTSLPSKSIENNARLSGKAGALITSSANSSQTATASSTTFTTSTIATTTISSTTTEEVTDSTSPRARASTISEDIAITTDNTTIIDIATTAQTTSSSLITTEAVVSKASPNGRRIENLECGDHGRNSGNNCICFDGYRGVLCQIPPIDLVCDKDRIQVTLSGDYAKDCFQRHL